MTDAAARHLPGCPQLRSVSLAYCRALTDASAEHLARCQLGLHVRGERFFFCQIWKNKFEGREPRSTISSFSARCPELRAVDFSGCGSLTDAAAASLSKCAQLEAVVFAHCG